MGFQLLHVLAARDLGVLTSNAFDSENIAWPLNIQNRAESRMWTAAPDNVIDILTKQNSTLNLHHDGVTPETYTVTPALTNTFRYVACLYTQGIHTQTCIGNDIEISAWNNSTMHASFFLSFLLTFDPLT